MFRLSVSQMGDEDEFGMSDEEFNFDLGDEEEEEPPVVPSKRSAPVVVAPPIKKLKPTKPIYGQQQQYKAINVKPDEEEPEELPEPPSVSGNNSILTSSPPLNSSPNLLQNEEKKQIKRTVLPAPEQPQPPTPKKQAVQMPDGTTSSISRNVYRLMLRQLQDDGFTDIARNLRERCEINIDTSLPVNALNDKLSQHQFYGVAHQSVDIDLTLDNSGPELQDKLDPVTESSARFGKYEARFQTSSKKPVAVTAFSRDGKFAASGSLDASIKLLDVGKMHYSVFLKHTKRQDFKQDFSITRPIIRTYLDHEGRINDLDFHPHGEWLLSAGKNGLILYWNLQKNWKRSAENIHETGAVTSIHCHPSGNFLLSAGDYPRVRLYDVETLQGYISRETKNHTGLVNTIRWAPEGNIFATCSKDGSIKIWDGVNMTCFNTINEAHNGCEVSTVTFSANSKYLLSSGKDSLVKLWDMSSGKCVMNYVGAHHKGRRLNASFSWNDEHVLSPCARTNALFVWDTKSGVLVNKIKETKQPINWVSSSPVEAALLMGTSDCKTKFLAVQEQTD